MVEAKDASPPEVPALPDHGLNAAAKQEYDTCVSTFAADLYAEAERLEAGQSSTGGGTEITSSMVRDANTVASRCDPDMRQRLPVPSFGYHR